MSVNYIIGGLRKEIPGESSIQCKKIDMYSVITTSESVTFSTLCLHKGEKQMCTTVVLFEFKRIRDTFSDINVSI